MKTKMKLLSVSLLSAAVFLSPLASAEKDGKKGKPVKNFDPDKVEMIHLDPAQALDSSGIISFASSGAWSDLVTNPNVYSAGSWVFGPLLEAPSSTPGSSSVQNITFNWNIWNYRSDLITYLCESTLNTCANVSGWFGGGVTVSAYNIPANRSWRFIFGVPGSGSLSPTLYGQNGSVAITYQ